MPGEGGYELAVLLNDIEVTSVSLTASTTPSQIAHVALPADLLVHDNALAFELRSQCVAPCRHSNKSAAWVSIATASEIQTSGMVMHLPNRLSMLPSPFFDPSIRRMASVAFVFESQPDLTTLKAAGVLASWYGAMAAYRGSHFTASFGQFSQGNLILLAKSDGPLAASLGLAGTDAQVAICDNPSDPYGKVLAIVAHSDANLVALSRLVAQNRFHEDTDRVYVNATLLAEQPPVVVKSPLWLETDRPLNITGDLNEGLLHAKVDSPGRLYFRIAPDLDYGTKINVPLHLAFHLSGLSADDHVWISIRLNDTFVARRRLSAKDCKNALTQSYAIPVSLLYPSNTLSVELFSNRSDTSVSDPAAVDLQILPATNLDLQNPTHFVRMPRLDLFAASGFPFTAKPDLSETTLVLPQFATAAQVGLYLDALGFMSAQTGVAAFNFSGINALGVCDDGEKNMLVIEAGVKMLSAVSGSAAAVAKARLAWKQALVWEKSNPAYAPAFHDYLNRYPDAELQAFAAAMPVRNTQSEAQNAGSKEDQLGYKALKNGDIAEAERQFTRGLSKDNSWRSQAGLGFANMKAGNFDAAVEQLEAAHQAVPHDSTIRTSLDTAKFWQAMNRGSKASDQQDWKKAVASFETAIALRPNDHEALRGLGGSLLAAGSPDKAIPYLSKAVRSQSADPSAWSALVRAKLQAEGGRAALAEMQSVPSSAAAALEVSVEWKALEALTYADAGEDGRALSIYRDLVTSEHGVLKPEEQLELASLALRFHQPAQAVPYAEKVVAAAPNQTGAWEVLLAALVASGKPSEAARAYARMPFPAQEIASTHPGFQETLASLKEYNGDLEGARMLVEQLVEKSSPPLPEHDRTSARIHLAQILAKLGRAGEAETMISAITDAHPDDLDAWRAQLLILQSLHRRATSLPWWRKCRNRLRCAWAARVTWSTSSPALMPLMATPSMASGCSKRISPAATFPMARMLCPNAFSSVGCC